MIVRADDIQVDVERCEELFQEMLSEAMDRHPYSGMALLQFKIKLRESVWEGARRWESKQAKKRRTNDIQC